MNAVEFIIGVIFVGIGLIGLHISWGDRKRQPRDYQIAGGLVALVSLGMVFIGLLRVSQAL